MRHVATLTGLAAVGALLVTIWVASPGWSQAPQPKWELTKEQKARAAKLKNPVAADKKAASIEHGKQLASQNCAPCHGPEGKGNGPAAAALPKRPADWTSKTVQAEPDAALFVRITDGNPPMPPWGSLSETDRWDLVNYIKSLGKKA